MIPNAYSPLARYLAALAAKLHGLWGGPSSGPDAPPDPFAGVREPRRRGPGGRHASVAVAEPKPDVHVHAIGRRKGRP